MFIDRVYDNGLAQASYFVACQQTGEAIVVDPRRDASVYTALAAREGFRITHITETHVHADFLSGTPELAAATDAHVLLSAEGGDAWRSHVVHAPLRDRERFSIGKIRFEVRHTPGHTPEHISFLLTDTATSDRPRMLFTGDFLFVGDVGRPDLLDEAAGMTGTRELGARDLFRSLRSIEDVPDDVIVWPGHGAGSACGKALGAVPVTSLGYERRTNPAYQFSNEEDFVSWILDGQPEAPAYFGQMKRLNVTRDGDSLLPLPDFLASVQPITIEDVAPSAIVLDIRNPEEFASKPSVGAINIPLADDMATWAGSLLAYDRDFVIVGTEVESERALTILYRIGLDRCVGRIDPETIATARDLGAADGAIAPINARDAMSLIEKGVRVIDVRSRNEYRQGHIDGAEHLFLGDLPERAPIGSPDTPILVHCQSGYRSSIAASILVARGHRHVYNLDGGYEAFRSI